MPWRQLRIAEHERSRALAENQIILLRPKAFMARKMMSNSMHDNRLLFGDFRTGKNIGDNITTF
jgi:hypothetical protein